VIAAVDTAEGVVLVDVEEDLASFRGGVDVDLSAEQRCQIHPLDSVEPELVFLPRIADDVDRHRPDAVGVVRERERGRLGADDEVERQVECLEHAAVLDRLAFAAFRNDPCVRAERAQRA